MKILGRKRLRTCLSMLLVVVCLLTSFSIWNTNALADNVIRMGTITASKSLNIRSGPGKEYEKVTYANNGDVGTIIDEATATDGTIWYKMNINGSVGWGSSNYIAVTVTEYGTDETFEQYLTQQGFPESYKEGLRGLHAMYPNWVFKAQHIQHSWGDVISNESVLARNLISANSKTSWKSTQDGAYDWNTGLWKVFDPTSGGWTENGSGMWVAASTEIIQYYMDPRNFFDTTNIFQFIEQSYNVAALSQDELNQVRTGVEYMAKGTYLEGACDNSSYVDVIMRVAAQTGVSPSTIASTLIQEQGTDGQGKSISGTNSTYPGIYNYFNIGAYPQGSMDSVTRGLWYASQEGSYGRPWNTREKSILGGATYYGKGYVNEGQDTFYLKKFDVADQNPYTHQYMTNIQAAESEAKHMSEGYSEEARKASLIFKIPVYTGMPETPCVKPTGNDKPVLGTSSNPNTGTGGAIAPGISSIGYTVSGSVIRGVSDFASTNVLGFLGKVSVANGTANITNSSGVAKSGDSKVGTGDQLRLYDSNGVHRSTYNIVVYGDTNGDGKVNALDLLRIQKNILKISSLNGLYNTAGDTSKDGKISALDLLQVQKQLLGIGTIKQ